MTDHNTEQAMVEALRAAFARHVEAHMTKVDTAYRLSAIGLSKIVRKAYMRALTSDAVQTDFLSELDQLERNATALLQGIQVFKKSF